MKYLNNYIIFAVLILSQLSLFTSCKGEKTVSELIRLDRTAIQIKEGSEDVLKIESGSDDYQFAFSTEGYATAGYRDNLVYIHGLKSGKVVLTITDSEGHRATVYVVVVSSVLNSDAQRFVWDGTIELNKANDWGLTVHENSIAVTNAIEGRQFVLSWDGILSVGVKENATLQILSSKEGAETQKIELAGMEVLQIQDNLCSIVFSTATQTGEFVFQK